MWQALGAEIEREFAAPSMYDVTIEVMYEARARRIAGQIEYQATGPGRAAMLEAKRRWARANRERTRAADTERKRLARAGKNATSARA